MRFITIRFYIGLQFFTRNKIMPVLSDSKNSKKMDGFQARNPLHIVYENSVLEKTVPFFTVFLI